MTHWKTMQRLTMALVLLALPALAKEAADTQPTMAGNTAFALDLYGQLRAQPGNLFFSPYSLSTALAMTYGGARGNTEKQMAAALRFTLPQDQLHPVFGALQARLNAVQKKGKIQLASANSLWPQKGYDFLPAFLDLGRQHYGATLTPLDYAGAPEAARKQINDWVEKQTNQKIQDLIQPGVLTPLTRLVLANAIYFKGNWATQFDPKNTVEAPFQLAPGKTAPVPMMFRKGRVGYASYHGTQVIELPYAGGELSMIVILPATVDGLRALEAQLTPALLATLTRELPEGEIGVLLPKFKITAEFSLNQSLATLGMTDAFSGKADFSGMNGQRDLFLSAVVHKAFVEVNEEGTTAAAATAPIIEAKAEPTVFRADHPFLFLIRDNQTGSILFLGRVANPTQ